jgi:hypothetical protein
MCVQPRVRACFSAKCRRAVPTSSPRHDSVTHTSSRSGYSGCVGLPRHLTRTHPITAFRPDPAAVAPMVPFAARWGGRFAPGASHPRSPLPRSARGAVPQVSAVGNGSLSRGREAHPDLGGRSVPRWRCPIRGRGGLPGADARSSLSQATWPCPPGHPIPHVKNRFESLPSENVDRSMQNCAGGGSGSSSTGARRSPLYAFIASVAARERVKRGPDLHPHRSVSRPQVGDSRLGLPRDSLSRDAGIHHAT